MNEPVHSLAEIVALIDQSSEQFVPLTIATDVESLADERDIARLARQALESPIDFPPLAAALVPGDHVAIAVDTDVPQPGAVLRGVLDALVAAGVDSHSVSVVTASAELAKRCTEAFSGDDSPPAVVVHDPSDKEQLCLIGLNKKKDPVTINRTIFDADVVLPIGCARVGGSAFSALFPSLSNCEAIAHFHTPAADTKTDNAATRLKEINDAGWLVGVLMTMLIVPGPNESISQILAGEPQATNARAQEFAQSLWSRHSSRQVSLVIANISGGAESQTWQNVGRAVAAAEPLLDEGGAIAICSNLSTPPGESVSRLLGSNDLEKTAQRILHDQAADSIPAMHLAHALQRGPVYFLSQLDADIVEELGFAPVDNVDDLARLAGRHESYAIIDDSQHAVVTVD